MIGSNRTTNEENYLLQKFARTVLKTNNIDHRRTTDYAEFASALAGHAGKTAESSRDCEGACAILLVGGNPTEEHPLLAWTLRTNVRLNRARLYLQIRNPSSWSGRRRLRRGCHRGATRTWSLCWSAEQYGFQQGGMAGGVAGRDLRRGVPRTGDGGADRVGIEARQCSICVAGRPLEFARRGGHGAFARSASGVCAGDGGRRDLRNMPDCRRRREEL